MSDLTLPEPKRLEPSIVDEQSGFWVINKPIGWTVQRDENAPSVLQWLKERFETSAFPVHRIDKPTSGLLLVAKNRETNSQLSQAFERREVTKTYVAISSLKPKKKQGWIKGDMAQSRRSQWKLLRSVNNPAITQFESELIEDKVRGFILHPKTGKTHQIRVALKSIGSPILGDKLYGGDAAERLYLHAWKIAFQLDGESYAYEVQPTGLLFEKWFTLRQGD